MLEHRGWWFIFFHSKILVRNEGGRFSVPLVMDPYELGLSYSGKRSLGPLDGIECYGCCLDGAPDHIPPEFSLIALRRLFAVLPDGLFGAAILGLHLANWDRTYLYCSRCGTPIKDTAGIRYKQCMACGMISFPRISPAVIVLVKDHDRILLGRSEGFENGLYSVLAGFVEPGETLEAAVAREVKEEVGISLSNISYFGSQAWPFPDSLMIAFTADYDGGKILLDGVEIADAGWFKVGQLPRIPDRISIARKLIDWFIEHQAHESC